MKTIRGGIVVVTLLLCAGAYAGSKRTQPQPLAPEDVPQTGNFYSFQGEMSDHGWPPLPFNPFAGSKVPVPVYSLGRGYFVYDDSLINYGGQLSFNRAEMDVASVIGESAVLTSFTMSVPFPGDEGGGGSQTNPPPDLRRNFEKFMGHAFSLVDTNDAASNDTNLYNACLSFPDTTNAAPNLQIARYGTNMVLLKANHFDYSGETERDFALLISDRVEAPIWKSVDLQGSSESQDGWLVQGLVENWRVTDPMFLLVSNAAVDCNAFFCAIPYSGPQLEITGVQPYDVVSNTITLQLDIRDLSGVSSNFMSVSVSGLATTCAVISSNAVTFDSKYAPWGSADVSVTVGNQCASLPHPESGFTDAKRTYQTTTTLPLYFDNPICVLSSGDMASPAVGTNYIVVGISDAQQVQATIRDPADGRIVRSYSGYVSSPGSVAIAWDYTEADGVTPYSNDTYAVEFHLLTPATDLTWVNVIDKQGVREAAGVILQYEEDLPDSLGALLNSELLFWGDSTAEFYQSLYDWDFTSIPQYTVGQIGPNRDNPSSPALPFVLNTNTETTWTAFLQTTLSNRAYSDFNFGPGHGSGATIGGCAPGTRWVQTVVEPSDIQRWAMAVSVGTNANNWRIRKAAIWACYSGDFALSTGGQYSLNTWPGALGIRDTGEQSWRWMMKNVGLFFRSGFPQGGYGSGNATSPEVALTFEMLWVCGPNAWPGACDPTYAFQWAALNLTGMYPELAKGKPAGVGYPFLPYTGIYDAELLFNDTSHVKTQ